MVTYEEALKIALSKRPDINTCHEYDKGYWFFDKYYDGEGDSFIVVTKDTGETMNFVSFIHKYHPNPKFKKREKLE